MKRAHAAFAAVALVLSLAPGTAIADPPTTRVPAIVSGDWLESHRYLQNLVVVDVRTAAEYTAGHIRDSVNIPLEVPVSAWIRMRDDLLLELPDPTELFATLGSFGITANSRVVLVTSAAEPPYPQANATRAAETLIYAGLSRVSILDGGYPAWVAQGKATTTAAPTITPATYTNQLHASTFVDTEYVYRSIGTASRIVDARDAEVYSGQVVETWADQAGHIPSAVSLPAPLIWNADGTYRTEAQLAAMVFAALGPHGKNTEIIVYCGVGGYASSWLFVLSQRLGYENVKMYDGSAQEWVKYHNLVR